MPTIETQFLAFEGIFTIVEISSLAFLFALVSETVWDVVRKRRTSLGDTFANTAIALVTAALERTVYGIIFIVALMAVAPFAMFAIPSSIWSIVLTIIAADFSYYWMHRCEHQIRLFWANHSVHHSSEEFNFTTSLRISWIDALIEWIFFIPMILLGFGVAPTVVGLVVVVAYQSWVHTEKIGKLGVLDGIFNTPSSHRVHHGSNAQYIDKNYGGILIVWDRLFGTYEPEGEKVRYGITDPVGSANPFTINFKEYRNIIRDMRKAPTWAAVYGHVFRSPGWKSRPQKTKADQ